MPSARPGQHSGCSPDCRYRPLYEGTLASLADLNDKLRESVGRHGRLRNNLISVLRKAFPQRFLRAERIEQRRMSDQSDEVLLRYLTMWLAERPGSALEPAPGLEDLRRALQVVGYVLPPDTDLSAWARAVNDQPQVRESVPAPVDGSRSLAHIFDPHTPPAVVEPGSSVGPGPVSESAPSGEPVAPTSLSDLFADLDADHDQPDTQVSSETEVVESSTAEQPADAEGELDPKGRADSQAGDKAEASGPSVTDDGEQGSPKPDAGDADAKPKDAGAERKKAPDQALRPALFAKPTRKTRSRRTPNHRASAASPSPDVDIPQQSGGAGIEVPASVSDRAIEAIKRPSPVFTRDLITLGVGSEEEIAAWEQEVRDSNDTRVRFIPPKNRHRARGALVLPHAYRKDAPAEFRRSVWAQVLDRYRGARLYEIAVLLQRVEPDLLSSDLEDTSVVFHLSQPRGTTAVVAMLGTDLERTGDDRAKLVEIVERLSSSPLTLLAVTVTNHHALADVIAALDEEARERDWSLPCPVISQRSWEYAADRGSSATLVLGG